MRPKCQVSTLHSVEVDALAVCEAGAMACRDTANKQQCVCVCGGGVIRLPVNRVVSSRASLFRTGDMVNHLWPEMLPCTTFTAAVINTLTASPAIDAACSP
jgi:hypothetical protein